jgi:hypothetical protein
MGGVRPANGPALFVLPAKRSVDCDTWALGIPLALFRADGFMPALVPPAGIIELLGLVILLGN